MFEQKAVTSPYFPYLFNGKELDQETGLYYYGARYYDPKLSLWMSVDPMAETSPHLSSYVYCNNNPIRLIDPDGRIVTVADDNAKRNIINSLSFEEAQYVRFNESGVLDVSLLNQYKGTSENYIALNSLANSQTNYVYAVTDKDLEGNSFFEKGSDLENPDNFYYGSTYFPGAVNNPSPDENVYIFTASFLNARTQTRNTAHEGYAHGYFYELSKTDKSINPYHTKGIVGSRIEYDPYLKQDVPVFIFGNTNTKLEEQILKVEQQALKNYDEKNK